MTSLLGAGPIPVNLRLLDHQIIGSQGELLGKVDDLLLERRDGELLLVALLSGPPALARRQGGRSEVWLDSIWRRLRPERDPVLEGLRLDAVTDLDSAVHVDPAATGWLTRSMHLERWLRRYVVSRLPWVPGDEGGDVVGESRGADEHVAPSEGPDAPTDGTEGSAAGVVRAPMGAASVGRLLGAQVRGDGGVVGAVIEVIAEPLATPAGRLGTLRVTSLVCSRRRLGNELGFTLTPQPPAALRLLMRRVHRDDVLIDVHDLSGLELVADLPRGARPSLVLRAGAATPHPHDVPRHPSGR